MKADAPVTASLIALFDHLGIERAHIAAGRTPVRGWLGLASGHPDRIASLTVVSPLGVDGAAPPRAAARMRASTGDFTRWVSPI